MIIYSNDPRGIKQAMAEELEKNPNAQIQLKKAPKVELVKDGDDLPEVTKTKKSFGMKKDSK